MSNIMLLLGIVMAFSALVQARHIHPHQHTSYEYEDNNEAPSGHQYPVYNDDGTLIDLRHISHSQPRFVPFNDAVFFKLRTPCDDGYQRDFLGICREVW